MKFNPIDIESFSSYEAGEYYFKVIKGESLTSKKGNPMIKLEVAVQVGNKKLIMWDYLLEPILSIGEMLNDKEKYKFYKLSQFCKSIGKEGWYKMGEINVLNLAGQEGKCYCDLQLNEQDKKEYLRIKYYIEPNTDEQPSVNDPAFKDDDIPF